MMRDCHTIFDFVTAWLAEHGLVGPLVVIHGERDRIIACAEGRALYEASPAERKRLLVIPKADHNNLLFLGLEQYMEAIATFCAGLA
jgi:fermentation-respiration switch protein FrsA (DUF1100 family)